MNYWSCSKIAIWYSGPLMFLNIYFLFVINAHASSLLSQFVLRLPGFFNFISFGLWTKMDTIFFFFELDTAMLFNGLFWCYDTHEKSIENHRFDAPSSPSLFYGYETTNEPVCRTNTFNYCQRSDKIVLLVSKY